MPKKTAAATVAPKKKAKPAPVEEVLDDEEFDEVEEDVAQEKPAKKATAKTAAVTFGMQDVAAHLTKKHKKPITARELRGLARRMARDNSGRVNREIVAGNRTRYDWPEGLDHPEVKAIIAAYEGGESEIEKQEKLAALKGQGAAKKAAAAAAAAPTTKKKAKKAPEPVVEEDEDDVELELDDEPEIDEDEIDEDDE